MSPPTIPTNIKESHREIISLQEEMKNDLTFKSICMENGLAWDFNAGYEPRWYNGPAPKDVRVLLFMAEPGAITPTEAQNLLPAVTYSDWIGDYDLNALEHYWRDNLRNLCRYIWPERTEDAMYSYLAGSCTFWMSLPPGSQTSEVPKAAVKYFTDKYLRQFIALFPNAIVIATGAKAKKRLLSSGIQFEHCSALTRPESNKPRAIKSWERVGESIASALFCEVVKITEATTMKKTSKKIKYSANISNGKSSKTQAKNKREHDSAASIAAVKPRKDGETLGEAHALAVLYNDKFAASVIHQAIAFCDPKSGYKILLHYPRCTYGQHYSDSLKVRRWGGYRASGLSDQFHELAKKAIKHKDDIKSLHDELHKPYKTQNKSNDIANKFRNKIRKIMNEDQ